MLEKYALYRAFYALRRSPGKESIRSHAKLSGLSVSSSKKSLDFLHLKGIVTRNPVGRLYQHSINHDSVLARHLKICMSLSELEDAKLVEELCEKYNALSIVLFGSAAQGLDTAKSDIDVLIITMKHCRHTVIRAQDKLGRELSIIKYTIAEWREKSKSDKAFYDNVIYGGIPLYGELPVVS
jgi:predicted nucleotidyltransferase